MKQPQMKITYDKIANAAYLYLPAENYGKRSVKTVCCDPSEIDGMINLDFDAEGKLIGIEILDADNFLMNHFWTCQKQKAFKMEKP
jgi:uncharacterized protein YuzE